MKTRERLAKRGDDLNYLKVARRMRTAIQIEEAMRERKVSKTQLAQMMGRKPSEITKWLSGNQNFTQDLLAEISYYLHADITGVSTPIKETYSSESYASGMVFILPTNIIKDVLSSHKKWTRINGGAPVVSSSFKLS